MIKSKFLLLSSLTFLCLTITPSAILFIAHKNVAVPDLPYQWEKDASIEFLICPNSNDEVDDIKEVLSDIKFYSDKKIKDTSVKKIDFCLCSQNMRPVTNTVEIQRSIASTEQFPTAVGRTESFWNEKGETLSACVFLPDINDKRFDADTHLRIMKHEFLHVFGKDHAMIFYNEKTKSGVGDPLHLMFKSVCSTCRAMNNL